MKRIITAAIASLALFAFAPIDADAGNGKKKNKRAQAYNHSGHNHNQNYRGQNYRGNNYNSSSSVRFFSAGPLFRPAIRPVPRYYGSSRPSYYRPTYGFPGPSLFFGGGGGHCR